MKTILILISAISLAGCKSPLNDARAEFLCKDNGEVYTYGWVYAMTSVRIICNDGKSMSLSDTEFREISDPWIAEYMEKTYD